MADRHYAENWARRFAREGRLPARYGEVWPRELDELAQPVLRPGMSILDVGSGRSPTIPPDRRPVQTRYVGLDVSGPELDRAGPGSYDEKLVADVGTHLPSLDNRFDLIVSWQALEHVSSLRQAFSNLRRYLAAGGRMIALISGRYSVFALANRLLPHRAAHRMMEILLGRSSETVFPAHYDRCWSSALAELLADWSAVEIRPKYAGASYFAFSPLLMRAYVKCEDRALGRPNLATYYLLAATR
jgi:SAM-dependent methyltransferase